MTEDQIKAIAEEYARLNPPHCANEELKQDGIYLNATMVFEPFLRFLNDHYCIVEREKAEQEYVYACGRSDNGGYYDGRATVLEDLFGTLMFNVIKDAPQYTAQCETCMRRIAGEVLEVCKDSSDQNRHCQWWNHENQDHCAYKIPWDKYPESYWRTILSPEQFAKAKLLNENKG